MLLLFISMLADPEIQKKTSKKEIVCGNHFLVGKMKMRKTMNVEHFFSMSFAMRQLLFFFLTG